MNSIDLFKKINDLIDVARMPLKRSTAYVVGDVAHVYALPSNLYLECIQAGTTSYYPLNLTNVNVKDELTDGTVIWRVADVKSGGGGHEIVETVPDVEDAEDNFVYFVPDEDNSPLSESTLAASVTDLMAEFQTFKDTIDYVVEYDETTDENGNLKWYRKHRSGWLEQGGTTAPTAAYNVTINFTKSFVNTDYTIVVSYNSPTNPSGGFGACLACGIKEVNNVYVGKQASNIAIAWYACGMGADE